MGIKKYFLDNEIYGADDVNAVFSHIVTGGVSTFDGTKSFTGEINDAMRETLGEGADTYNPDSCLVAYEDGVCRVKSGVCFMPNGMCLEVDSAGFELSVTGGEEYYVYAEYSETENDLSIKASQTQSENLSVPLAFINKDGTVEDRRQFASAKVGISSSNIYKDFTLSVNYSETYEKALENKCVYDAGFAGFKFVYAEHTSVYSSNKEHVLLDVSDGKEHQIDTNGTFNTKLYVQKQGTKLYVYGTRTNNTATLEKTFKIL